MKFENKNLKNFTGLVLVDKDGFPKLYSSYKVAKRSAEKVNGIVIGRKNIRGVITKYIISKDAA